MSLPKKVVPNLSLVNPKTGLSRREELLERIQEGGTFLPKSILHEDLDKGFLDFVKNDLKLVVSGKLVPTVDIIITTQNWAQFTQTWNFQNIDKNAEPPFITVVRSPEGKYGSTPSLQYRIPNSRQFFYAAVPTWNGDRKGLDVYTIPQPIPIDLTFSIKIVCNRMRELNSFNKIILGKFSSRQSYTNVKGHYIPIILNSISDESVNDLEKRRYYSQSYDFTMMGFLIDEDEFEVKPAVSRALQLIEVDNSKKLKRPKKFPKNPDTFDFNFNFSSSNDSQTQTIEYTSTLKNISTNNVTTYSVYINSIFFGNNVSEIWINQGDTLTIEITKTVLGQESYVNFSGTLN